MEYQCFEEVLHVGNNAFLVCVMNKGGMGVIYVCCYSKSVVAHASVLEGNDGC